MTIPWVVGTTWLPYHTFCLLLEDFVRVVGLWCQRDIGVCVLLYFLRWRNSELGIQLKPHTLTHSYYLCLEWYEILQLDYLILFHTYELSTNMIPISEARNSTQKGKSSLPGFLSRSSSGKMRTWESQQDISEWALPELGVCKSEPHCGD